MTSYRDYRYVPLTTSQVDYGGALPGDTLGTPQRWRRARRFPATGWRD